MQSHHRSLAPQAAVCTLRSLCCTFPATHPVVL
nr:MAG TPA: hypothetical protein [Caudoviricetes sp.]